MRSRGAVAVLGFLFLVGAFAGFAHPAAAQDPTGMLGGDLRVALQGFGGLDPTTATDADRRVLSLIYDSLGRIDPATLEIIPWAATGWAWDGDKNYTVTLRDDLRFSDGTAYDADDVAASLNRYTRGGTQRWQAVAVDPTTVRMDLTAINPATYDFKTVNQAGPGAFWTEGLTALLAWDAAGNRKYGGPFAFQSSTATSLVLVANEHHFAGRPFLDSVTYLWPYTLDLDASGNSQANDAGCALMFRQVHLIGWTLLANDLTNTRDCTDFGGFPLREFPSDEFSSPGLDPKWTWTNTPASYDVSTTTPGALHVVSSTGVDFDNATFTGNALWNDVLGDFSATMKLSANPTANGQKAGLMVLNVTGTRDWYQVVKTNAAGAVNWRVRETVNATTTNRVDVASGNPIPAWVRIERVRNTFTALNSTDGTKWTLLDTYRPPFEYPPTMRLALTFADGGSGTAHVVDVDSVRIIRSRESLLSTDQNRTVRHVLAAKNPGNEFLYFGFTFGASSFFTGAPGSEGEKLRSAIYKVVNKGLYRDIEPNSAKTHGLVNAFNTPWSPLSCAPWSPCNFVMEAGTVAVPAPVLRKTNTDPFVIALNSGGFFDRDGDGIRHLSTGGEIAFRFIAPSFTLDPRKTTIANDMQSQLRIGGLDVTVEVHDSWAALDAAVAACTTGCMYVKRYAGATQLPDWYYASPELLAANDPMVNLHLNLGAATSWTKATRATHVGHVSHLSGQAADLIPVVHFDALEAFDFETFDGWVNAFGGLNNFWSITGLHLPNLGSLSATVDIFPTRTLGPGDTTDVQVTVRDQTGLPVEDVTVELTAQYGTLTPPTNTTDASGIVRTTYRAPATIATVQDDWVTAVAWAGQWVASESTSTLTLHPDAPGQLDVAVSRGNRAEINSSESVTITVEVRDPTNRVSGATVRLSTDLPGATFSPASGTTVTGFFNATFTATVKQGMTYRIFADVSAAGFEDGSNRDSPAALSVRTNVGDVPVVQTTRNVPGFEAVSAVAAIAAVFALVALARRRRED